MSESIFTAKITSKRQVTLPKGLCDRLGLREGDKVTFVEDEAGVHVEKDFDRESFEASLSEWQTYMKPRWKELGFEDMTSDEISREIRGPDPVDEIEQSTADA